MIFFSFGNWYFSIGLGGWGYDGWVISSALFLIFFFFHFLTHVFDVCRSVLHLKAAGSRDKLTRCGISLHLCGVFRLLETLSTRAHIIPLDATPSVRIRTSGSVIQTSMLEYTPVELHVPGVLTYRLSGTYVSLTTQTTSCYVRADSTESTRYHSKTITSTTVYINPVVLSTT